MIKNSIWVAAALLAQLSAPTMAANSWHIDSSHSTAEFRIKHLMISTVSGTIRGITGTGQYDGKDVKNLSVDAQLDATTISTGEPARDKHLKSADFFNVEKFPTITFKSKRMTGSHGKYKLIGDLTMHGITKEVTLDMDAPTAVMKDPKGNERVGAEARTTVNRTDYDITWNKNLDQGGVMVGDPVDITIDVELIKDKDMASSESRKKAS